MPALEQHGRGTKRKRLEDKEEKLRRKLARLSRQFLNDPSTNTALQHYALKELAKVVKKGRTFEVRKTLKKLRDARQKDPKSDTTTDLEAQMEVLKHLGCDQLARSALVTKLNKDKTLSADPTIRAVAVELTSHPVSLGPSGTPAAKVHSRILSSKMLALEVMSVVEALRALVQPPVGSQSVGEAVDNSSESLTTLEARNGRGRDGVLSKDETMNGFGAGRNERYENTSGDEAVGGWESGTGSDTPSGSDDGEAYDHDTGGTDVGLKGRSEFLPSLSVGYVRGESDSELSDGEPKCHKRNRRGQRARRAIWEKKFGKNARHIRNAVTERRQTGSVPVDRRSSKGTRTPTLELHPSWEAKRKQRPATIVPSQATKIVFDS